MENSRAIKFFTTLLGGMLIFGIPLFLFSYSDETTHPALTDEMVDHFNRFYSERALSISQKELVKLGSIEEDEGIRWLQHFYDPVYNRGLVLLGEEFESSKNWSQDTLAQAGILEGSVSGSLFSLFSSDSDFSWERAVYEYAWGDKNRAMLSLGHVLHLIEDASVPDHTRNDPHPHLTEWFSTLNESPYESWTKKFTPDNFSVTLNEPPIILGGLGGYFDSMARYSNGNFFSKDTIASSKYFSPFVSNKKSLILSNGKQYIFGIWDDGSGNNYLLVKLESSFLDNEIDYSIDDPDNLILTDYWTLLSKQAVLHGAGVMKLFFDEVEKEKETKVLYEKNRSWLQKTFDKIWGSFAGILFSVDDGNTFEVPPPSGGETSVPTGGETLATTDNETSTPTGGEISAETSALAETEVPTEIVALSLVSSEPVTQSAPPPQQNQPMVFLSGGGGSPASPSAEGETPAPSDTTPPDAPIILAPSATSQTTDHVLFSGMAEANAEIFTDFDVATTTTDAIGAWTLALDLPQGTTTLNFSAKDAAGNTSVSTPITLFVDSEAPNLTFAVAECASSLSDDGCLVATTTLAVRWFSGAEDLATYTISCAKAGGGECVGFLYDNTATSTSFAAENNQIYTFTATAKDTAGNESNAAIQTVEIRTNPVVINEIAWAGTQANDADEWIELFNASHYAINLFGWRLYSETDNKPYIELSGIIQPNGYYLIERTDDNTVSDILADWMGSFGASADGGSGLSNIGEVLVLAYGSTTIDQTPALNACGRRRWCGGDASSNKTSERIDPFFSGTNSGNWVTNNGIIRNGKDVAGTALNGTPKQRNSVNYSIGNLWSVQENRTLSKERSPYLIDQSSFTIPAGKVLTLESGTVVKFVSTQSPSLFVNGTVKAEGTAENPVVFTSFFDDEYGGDTNQDGVCNPADASSTAVCPQAGSWKQIVFQPTSENSILDHTIIRYGGRWFNVPQAFRAMLAVDDAEIQLTNSMLEYSWGHGLRMINSDSVIENNMFRYNTRDTGDTGFYIGGGAPTIRGNISSYNSIGGLISNIGGIFSDNTFSNNTYEALLVSGAIPATTNTTASANGTNGILLQSIPSDFTFLRGLPYIIESQSVLSSGNYTFEAGAILKFKGSVSGLTFGVPVAIAGSGAEPIVFTSYTDDAYGGDTNNDGICAPEDTSSTAACPGAGAWRGLKFTTGADTSTLDNVMVRYAGSHSDWAGIKADSASLAISNSVIEQNSRKGIWLLNSASTTITDTIIRNHTTPNGDATVSGLYLSSSHADIGGLTFRDNTIGINALPPSTLTITAPIDIDGSNIIKTLPPDLLP